MRPSRNQYHLILSLFIVLIGFSLTNGARARGSEETPATELRIGTTDRVLSANILLDSNLALFAHLSNPPLMKMSPEGKLVGQLVEEVRISQDHTTWTFVIADNLYWSDGKKVTAEDIQFTLEYTRDKLPAAGWLQEAVKRISVSGQNTVVLRLDKPRARLGVEFTTYKILPRHVWQSIQDHLRALNIRVTLKHIDRTTWTNFKDQYRYDLTVTRTSPATPFYLLWPCRYS